MGNPRLEFDPRTALETIQRQYFDACKLQFETSLQVLDAIVASAERMREVQIAAARETQGQHRRASGALGRTGNGRQLLELEGTVLSDYMRSSLQYWKSLAEVAQQTQADLMRILKQSSGRALQSTKKK